MAIKYGFFNSVDGDRKYSAEDIGRYLHGLVSSGVYADEADSLQVLANGGMQIAVQSGRAMLDYHYMENDEPLVLELSAGGTMDRIDIVVARLDLSERLCDIIVREGTPATAPTRPIIYKTDLAKEYLLASIYVTKLATSITQSDITDTRADDTVCGWVRSIVGQGNAGIPVPAQSDAGKVPVVKPDGSGYNLKDANELGMSGDMDMGGHRITTLAPPKDGTDAATMDYVDHMAKTKRTTGTISTSWSGSAAPYTQTLNITGVEADSIVEISLPTTVTAAQVKAYQALNLQDGGQAAGTITLRAFGEKNSVSIPINVVVRRN